MFAAQFELSPEQTEDKDSIRRLYNDGSGNCTIGIGTLVHEGPCAIPYTFEHDSTGILNGRKMITKQEVRDLYHRRLEAAEEAIRENVTVDLTQSQFDALVSLLYSKGAHLFEEDTGKELLALINAGQFDEAAAMIEGTQLWQYDNYGVWQEGLLIRRQMEAELFRSGTYAFDYLYRPRSGTSPLYD